jgi:ATP-dependent DNA ligase
MSAASRTWTILLRRCSGATRPALPTSRSTSCTSTATTSAAAPRRAEGDPGRAVAFSAGCARLLYVDHVDEGGDRLLDAVREVGAEGIIAKRRAGRYRSGPSRDWLKTKVAQVSRFVVTGFRDGAPGEIEAITVAEIVGHKLSPAGEVQFGVGRRLRGALDAIRLEPRSGSRRVPVRPMLMAGIKYFGRHRNDMIRDGVVRAVAPIDHIRRRRPGSSSSMLTVVASSRR